MQLRIIRNAIATYSQKAKIIQIMRLCMVVTIFIKESKAYGKTTEFGERHAQSFSGVSLRTGSTGGVLNGLFSGTAIA